MRNFVRTSCVLATVLTFGVAACGDDTTDPGTDTTSPTDTMAPGDTTTTDTETGSDTTVADTTPADPCDPNPCTNVPAPMCNEAGDTLTTYSGPGTCTVANNAASCEYADDGGVACDAEEICANGACRENPTEYTPAPASYISTLAVGDQSCCDQTGNGQPNNKLGSLLGLLGEFPQLNFNVEEAITEAIEGGSLVVLFDFPGLSGAGDQSLDVRGFVGDRVDDHETSIAGNGSFTVSPSSFVPDTFISQIEMGGAIASGEFSAGPANFTLSIPLDEFGVLSLSIANTTLESTVSVGANGEGLSHVDGKLAGVIPFAEFVGAFNGLAAGCDCFNMPAGAEAFEVKTTNNVQGLGCTAAFTGATPTCDGDVDGSLCEGLGENQGTVCGLAAGILTADIDTDLDGVKDAMSAFLTFEGVSATITGVTATE